MVFSVAISWLAISVLVAIFIYCCSRVSNGSQREIDDEARRDELGLPITPVSRHFDRPIDVEPTWPAPSPAPDREIP